MAPCLTSHSSLSTPLTPHTLHTLTPLTLPLSPLTLYTLSPLSLYLSNPSLSTLPTPHTLHTLTPHTLPPSPPLPYSGILDMVGQAELEMASQIAQYEIMLGNDVISPLTAMLEVMSQYCPNGWGQYTRQSSRDK